MIIFEDVKNQTIEEYFNNNAFSIDVFKNKYALTENETYVQALKRVCDFVASVEKTKELREYWSKKWFDEIYNQYWHPAGSIMRGANSCKKISLCNCTYVSLGGYKGLEWDSLEGIFKNTAYTVAKCAAYRQGLGVDFSHLRPRKMSVLNSSNESTGAVHWMSFIDGIARYVGQKGRVPAFLFSMSIKHPDIEEFITIKSDYTKIQNANISTQITDDFYQAVHDDEDWELIFEIPEVKKGQIVYIDVHSTSKDCKKDDKGWYYIAPFDRPYEKITKKIKSRHLLELIAKNMACNAEPGIQNIDIARKYSNSDYLYDPNDEHDTRILGSNACCFAKSKDVWVITQKGYKELKTITKDDLIWIDFELKWAKTFGYFESGNENVYEVCFSNQTKLYITMNHKLMSQAQLIELKNLKVGSTIWVNQFDPITNIENRTSFVTIVSITHRAFEKVGCIEVENYHQFTANGIISGNSEQYLSRESLCVLSSINCEKFSTKPEEYEKELEIIGSSINRFLDNVNECELTYQTYATPHQRMAIEKLRRTGAGYTNIAGWLFKQNLEYGSKEGNVAMAKFTECYNYHLYKSSIILGKEKGNFGAFNREKFEKSPFIKRMIGLGLEFKTMRNVTCSSIAPVGTLNLMFRNCLMSYGIEPAFGMYFWKRTRISGRYDYYFCVPRIVRDVFRQSGYEIPIPSDTIKDTWDGKFGALIVKFIEDNKDKIGIKFKKATEIYPLDKLDLMSKVMKWIDSSISTTYLLPEDSNWKDVYNFILEAHKKEVKSIAAFPDKKMYGIVSFIPFKELALKLKNEGVEIHQQNFSEEELKELNISKENIQLNTTIAPKRLKTLDADIYAVTVKGKKFIVVIGFQNGAPYEVFGGHTNGLNIKTNKKGKITRLAQGKYSLEFDDIIIEDFSQQFTPVEKILFRMCSTMLRHGMPIAALVDQLQKSTDDITSLASAVCRVLKRYIKDGQKVYGQSCPVCKSTELIYSESCINCVCGFSKCS